MPKLISTYGLVGRVTASETLSTYGSEGVDDLNFSSSSGNMKSSNSFQVTSHWPIQNGEIFTLCCGLSSDLRPGSLSGLPMENSPPRIGAMANLTSVPGMVFV